MNPLVSIIIPVHNGQDYLEKCIESIWNQTYEPIEVIIVNDESTDNTGLVCKKLQNKYGTKDNCGRSIQVIELMGKHGVSAARNAGIELARGEFISFVDSDDRIMPDMIEVLYKGIEYTGASVSGCGFFMWKSCDEIDKHNDQIEKCEYKTYTSEEFQLEIINSNTRCWSKLYRRDIFDGLDHRFDTSYSIGEDMLFLAQLTQGGYMFCETPYKGYAYYQNIEGVMVKKFDTKAMEQVYCWEKARDILGASPKLESNIIISALLTIGRIARLSKKEQDSYISEISIITDTIKRYYSREAYSLLDKGYKLKTSIYRISPRLYLWLYSNWKKG